MNRRYQQRRRCCGSEAEGKQLPPKPTPVPPSCKKDGASTAPPAKGPTERAEQLRSSCPSESMRGLLPGGGSGELMALMILMLLLLEGKEDSRGTILTLLIFLLL